MTNAAVLSYAHIKRVVSLTMILARYGVLESLRPQGRQLRGACPIHGGTNKRQFLVNAHDNTWHCFGDCDRGGSTLEFVAEIERIEIHEAAVRIASWFALNPPHEAQNQRRHGMSEHQRPSHKVFTVEDRGEGDEADAFWTRIGSAWPHKDDKGLNVVLSALPMNGRLVLREYSDDDAKADAERDNKSKPARRK